MRTTSTFSPAHSMAGVMSKMPAVKQPGYSPIFVPFNQTAVPNWALFTRRVATDLPVGAVNVRRYQKKLRSCRDTPGGSIRADSGRRSARCSDRMRFEISSALSKPSTSGNGGVALCTSPGTSTE
jgi:hypothetical protein